MRGNIPGTAAAALFALYLVGTLPAYRVLPRSSFIPLEIQRVSSRLVHYPNPCILCSFETPQQAGNWIGRHGERRGVLRNRSRRHATDGRYSLLVQWRLKRWGELVSTTFPQEWKPYKVLAFDIFDAGGLPFTLEVRIGENFDFTACEPELSRFAQLVRIEPGNGTVRIPLRRVARVIDLNAPRKVIRLRIMESDRIFYLDNVRLER